MTVISSAIEHIQILHQHRHLICKFEAPFQVLSTCSINGGQRHDLTAIVNHQSCEGKSHQDRTHRIVESGPALYHRDLCVECALHPETTACMGTAANMQYAFSKIEPWEDLTVQAIVTAGVSGNAQRAGDPSRYHEFSGEWKPVAAIAGTINTILLINHPLNSAALSRSAVTMTEAKSAVLQDLNIGSLYSRRLATGTGTDQFAIAAPIDPQKTAYSWSGGHTRLGELIGRAVYAATKEAIKWQNGLHPELTRSCFHILKRLGFKKELFREKIQAAWQGEQRDFLLHNELAIEHDPEVSSAALAISATIDAFENGMLPEHLCRRKVSQQLALMACSLSSHFDKFEVFQHEISQHEDWIDGMIQAISLGFNHKWQA